jgi:D-lactate dehydrogenase
MRVALFSAKPYDRASFTEANARHGHDLVFFEPRLGPETAALAAGFPVVCPFVNDRLDAEVIGKLAAHGTRLVALRSAGFNHVDLEAADRAGLVVTRVPAYSPHAVAEHTVALILSLDRKIYRAYARVREGNFSLDGLLGFDLLGRTAGVVGTGKIGLAVCRILAGFGCRLLAFDPRRSVEAEAMGVHYMSLDAVLAGSDIVTLHCPLTPETHHLIGSAAIDRMKRGVMLVNTGRGGLIDTRAVIAALKTGHIGYLGLDVYEEEAALFFADHSHAPIQDDLFARLLTFPNVLITGHQGFFTAEALAAIAETALESVSQMQRGQTLTNRIEARAVRG